MKCSRMDENITIHIPVNKIQNKVVWKFSSDEKFSVKTVTWTINNKIPLHPRVKFLNSI